MSARRRLRAVVAVLALLALLGAGAGSASGEGVVEGVLSRASATVNRTAEGALARQTSPADASQEERESVTGPPAGDASAEGAGEPPAETAGGGDGAPASPGTSRHREPRPHASGPPASGTAGHPLGGLVSNVTSAVPGAGRASAAGRVLHDAAAPAVAAVRSVPVPTLPSGETLPAVGTTLLGAARGVAEGLLSGAARNRPGGVLGAPGGGPWEPALGLVATFSPAGAIASLAGVDAGQNGVAGQVAALPSQDLMAAPGVAAQAGTGAASALGGRQRPGIEGVALGAGADLARAGGGGGASRGSGLTHRSPLAPIEPGSALAGAAAAGIVGVAIALMALVSTRPPGRLRRLLGEVPLGPSEPFALLLSRPG